MLSKTRVGKKFRPLGLHETTINSLASLPRDGIGAMFNLIRNISGSPLLLFHSHLQGFQTVCKVLQHLPSREKAKKKRNGGTSFHFQQSSEKGKPCSSERLRCRACSLIFKLRFHDAVKEIEGGGVE